MAKKKENDGPELVKTWRLPSTVTLGSAVRLKGILQEIRAHLSFAIRKSLDLEDGVLTLAMPETSRGAFRATSAAITDMLAGIATLPVIPREIEDILAISSSERHRWINDGRLPSAGTRTVKLKGRARQITFHICDPAVVMDLLDHGAVDEWREEDAVTAAENRRRAALKAKLTRSLKKKAQARNTSSDDNPDDAGAELQGWDAFGADGLLR